MAHHVDPWLHDALGFLPMFSGAIGQNGLSFLTAIAILTIMIVPMSSASPSVDLRPGGRLRRRRIVNRVMESIGTLAALLAVAVLVVVVVSVARRGAHSLSWHFLVTEPKLFGGAGGGISNAIVGT